MQEKDGSKNSKIPPSEEEGLAQVVALAQSGDEAAFGELFTKYNELLIAFIFKRIRESGCSFEDARDLAADVWVKVYQNIETYDISKSPFLFWLLNIVTKQVAGDFLRKRARRYRLFTEKVSNPERAKTELSSHEMDELEIKLELEQLEKIALENLPPLDLAIIRDLYIRGLSASEVLEKHSLRSEGALRTRLSRIRKKLRGYLDDDLEQVGV